jgi:uncharacterized protein YchJ
MQSDLIEELPFRDRNSGKTSELILRSIIAALVKPNSRILYATTRSSQQYIKAIIKKEIQRHNIKSKFNQVLNCWQFSNGSELMVEKSKQNEMCGVALDLYIDDTEELTEYELNLILPTLITTNGKILKFKGNK